MRAGFANFSSIPAHVCGELRGRIRGHRLARLIVVAKLNEHPGRAEFGIVPQCSDHFLPQTFRAIAVRAPAVLRHVQAGDLRGNIAAETGAPSISRRYGGIADKDYPDQRPLSESGTRRE